MAHVANGGGNECPGINKMIDNFESGYDYITNEGYRSLPHAILTFDDIDR